MIAVMFNSFLSANTKICITANTNMTAGMTGAGVAGMGNITVPPVATETWWVGTDVNNKFISGRHTCIHATSVLGDNPHDITRVAGVMCHCQRIAMNGSPSFSTWAFLGAPSQNVAGMADTQANCSANCANWCQTAVRNRRIESMILSPNLAGWPHQSLSADQRMCLPPKNIAEGMAFGSSGNIGNATAPPVATETWWVGTDVNNKFISGRHRCSSSSQMVNIPANTDGFHCFCQRIAINGRPSFSAWIALGHPSQTDAVANTNANCIALCPGRCISLIRSNLRGASILLLPNLEGWPN